MQSVKKSRSKTLLRSRSGLLALLLGAGVLTVGGAGVQSQAAVAPTVSAIDKGFDFDSAVSTGRVTESNSLQLRSLMSAAGINMDGAVIAIPESTDDFTIYLVQAKNDYLCIAKIAKASNGITCSPSDNLGKVPFYLGTQQSSDSPLEVAVLVPDGIKSVSATGRTTRAMSEVHSNLALFKLPPGPVTIQSSGPLGTSKVQLNANG